jgi:adenylosuccinate lyase
MMEAVKRGGDRQELHEIIRTYSMEAGKRVKEEGLDNDLIDRIAKDPRFGMTEEEIKATLVPSAYIGRCKEQVERFVKEEVDPILSSGEACLGMELTV